jgi:hypothetical protein
MDAEEIPGYLTSLAKSARAIEKTLIDLSWYLRSTPVEQVYMMSNSQREAAFKLIEKNIENTKESGTMMH